MCSAKLDLRRVPKAYRRAFGWILQPIKLFHSDPMAFVERPVASFARVEREFAATWEKVIADGGPEAFVRRMLEPAAAMTSGEWAEVPVRLTRDVDQRRRHVARLPSGEPLLALIEAAHQQVTNAPLLAILDQSGTARLGLPLGGAFCGLVTPVARPESKRSWKRSRSSGRQSISPTCNRSGSCLRYWTAEHLSTRRAAAS